MADWFKYCKVEFKDKGRDWKGCDCWGLGTLIYKEELGIELPSYGDISAHDLIKVSKAISEGSRVEEVWKPIEKNAVRPYDFCLMHLAGTKRLGHVGIVIDGGHIIHIEKGVNAAIVPFDHYTVRERITGFRRHRSLI